MDVNRLPHAKKSLLDFSLKEQTVAIPESQFDTWSHQGSITNSSNTYNAVKNVLTAPGVAYSDRTYEVFLQGSYGNDTNIHSESDVDIVIKTDSVYYSDTSKLSEDDKQAFDQAFIPATYTLAHFKQDVTKTLKAQYGTAIAEGAKAITIAPNGNRRKADVIVAAQFRRYWAFKGQHDQKYTEGICFFNSAGTRIANYPKLHSANLTTKHQATGEWLKPMIRVLKNMRSRMISNGILKAGVAPSYYIEGLLYNVPTVNFGSSYRQSFVNAISWLQTEAKKEDLVCANEQYYLLRDVANVCWSPADAEVFLNALTGYWK